MVADRNQKCASAEAQSSKHPVAFGDVNAGVVIARDTRNASMHL
jgi:hypothetical protein